MRKKRLMVFNTTLDACEKSLNMEVNKSESFIKGLGLEDYGDGFCEIVKKIGLINPEHYAINSFFSLENYKIVGERKRYHVSVIIVDDDGARQIEASEGTGPVNALFEATKKTVKTIYSDVDIIELVDYRVRTLRSGSGSDQDVYVVIEFSDGEKSWVTIGFSSDVLDASWKAITRGLNYFLMKRECSNFKKTG